MVVNWYGEACFKLQTGGLTILTDPFEAESGITPPRLHPDIVIRTKASIPLSDPFGKRNDGGTAVLGPGEYELQGIEVKGWPLEKESGASELKTYYAVEAEDLRLAFLGYAAAMPDPTLLENLGRVDILFLPASGTPFLAVEDALTLIKQLNPKLVVASLFKVPGLKRKAGDAKEFFEELEQPFAIQEKIAVKAKDLPERLQAVALSL